MSSADQKRTVTLRRGPKGFGFNLAEQYPCYLSAVHEGGVADRKGLLVGDSLVAINGVDVTCMPHKEIVEQIASSNVDLEITVVPKSAVSSKLEDVNPKLMSHNQPTEDDSSSESDSDNEVWRRQRIHLAHRMKSRAVASGALGPPNSVIAETVANADAMHWANYTKKHQSRSSGVKLQNTNFFGIRSKSVGGKRRKEHSHGIVPAARYNSAYYSNTASLKSYGKKGGKSAAKYSNRTAASSMNRSRSEPDFLRDERRRGVHQTSLIVHPGDEVDSVSSSSESDSESDVQSTGLILKAVLVYIGAVPVPHLHMSRKHIVRSALQSLRAQNVRAHTVLLEIFPHQVVVTNSKRIVVNRFRSDCIAFVASCIENKQFFGVTTVHGTIPSIGALEMNKKRSDTGAAVCHVFAVDPELHLHSFHYNYARKFDIHCSKDPLTNFCSEFPYISSPILNALSYITRNQQTIGGRSSKQQDVRDFSSPPIVVADRRRGYHSSNSDSGIGNGHDEYRCSSRDTPPKYAPAYPGVNRANLRTLSRNEFLHSSDDVSQTSTSDMSSLMQAFSSGNNARNSGNLKVRFDEAANSFIETTTTTNIATPQSCQHRSNASTPSQSKEKSTAEQLPAATRIINSTSTASACRKSSTMADNVGTPQPPKTCEQASKETSPHDSQVKYETEPYHLMHVASSSSQSKKTHSDLDLLLDTPVSSAVINNKTFIKATTSSVEHTSSYPKRASNSSIVGGRHLYCSSSVNDVSQLKNLSRNFDDDDDDDAPLFAVPAPVLKSASSACEGFVAGHGSSVPSSNTYGGNNASCQSDACASASLAINNQPSKHGSLLKRLARVDMRLSIRMKQVKKERLDSWASDFEKLLRDSAGLYAFSEFLLTQYSQENVNFWIACENFKVADENERAKLATDLFEHHFSSGCSEPINIDFATRKPIQDMFNDENFSSNMFDEAQHQIYRLMKDDCYPRFLKSDEYHHCWECVEKGGVLPEMKELFLKNTSALSGSTLSLSSKSTARENNENGNCVVDDKKRKSFLPWKQKFAVRRKKQDSLGDGGDVSEQSSLSSLGNKRKHAWRSSKHLSTPAEAFGTVHANPEALPSRLAITRATPDVVPQPDPPSSPSPGPNALTSSGECEPTLFCTAILPSREKVTLPVYESLTVGEWLRDVACRFGLNPAATDIFDIETDEIVNVTLNAGRWLAGRTFRLGGGVLFKVDIPCADSKKGDGSQRKLVDIKAQADSTSAQALRPILPILSKYGLCLDNMIIMIAGTNEVLPNHAPITQANNKKLMVLTQEEFQDWIRSDHDNRVGANKKHASYASTSTLNENNANLKVSTLSLKCNGEVRDESRDSSVSGKHNLFNGHKGGGMLKFVKKPEMRMTDRKSSASVKGVKASAANSAAVAAARVRKSTASVSREEIIQRSNDEKKLAELLSRAQASSFDDQRGSTVKNFDLPEFLKPKSPEHISIDDSVLCVSNEKSRPCRPTDMVHRRLCVSPNSRAINTSDEQSEEDFDSFKSSFDDCRATFDDDTFVVPSHEDAERLFETERLFGGGEDAVDFHDPRLTERKSLSDFGFTKSANVSVIAVGSAPSDVSFIQASTENVLNLPLNCASENGEKSSSPRRLPPPYPGQNVRGSLKKSLAIDDRTTTPNEEEADPNFVAKRKGLYVDEEDWQVDYV